MKFSERIQNVSPSMTLAIDAKAKEMKARGEDVIGFGAGEPDFNTPERIKQAGIKAIQNNETRYTPVGGSNLLKEAIITKLERDNGLSYEKNQILASCGAKHSFYNLAQVLWQAGDEVIIPAPYWVSFPEIVILSGARPLIVHAGAEQDFKITPEQIENAVTPNTKAILINSPSNPTGSAYDKNELEKLAEVALRHNLLIITDEIYEQIVFDGFQHTSIASISQEVQKQCVVINGVSKSYAMTGWRIGYIAAGDPEIVKQVGKLQGQSTSNPCAVSQAASIEALTGPLDEVHEMVREFEKRRNIIVEQLSKIPGVTCNKPKGSFYSFPDFSGVYGKKDGNGKVIKGSIDFTDYLLSAEKVAIVPGIAFGADAHARLSFATSLDKIEAGVHRIKEAISRLRPAAGGNEQ
ncbi:MAG: pyridoxal phosphate-dependent aminotransferase [Nitrospina sp.]|jgi:aspartate aminotransferase|nr:pyridoxal phosphate-dependent aminotransferase [Nitrospina sp.]MBT3509202.1 pyridoxal phosphate-dependent aminotransferase [Nitrospina sp.]MBT3877153.1 pyridoxal phosphate-dependent aminotransferase [Nitrospina sp.]MBT4048128.1 pyridoxal phosphate-dependent aminotransferase [Nitrospina sp.]MBT4559166.1 pyridoxal phosphate-dependent aminotransferase [Nitrospina sp.]